MRIYLAATQDLYSKRTTCEVEHLLLSYGGSNVTSTRNLLGDGWQAAGAPTDWCVDSGAHFFISAYFKKAKLPPVEEAEAHMMRFIGYLRGLKTKPAFAVELDLQDLYGTAVVNRWRERYWKPFEAETGVRVCYVWHACDAASSWEALLADPDVRQLGIGGLNLLPKGAGAGLVVSAYKAGKPVHGFACVRRRVLLSTPFYTVDSTSWGAASMFGVVGKFNANRGTISAQHVGRSDFLSNKRRAAGDLLRITKGRVRVQDMQQSKGAGLARMYQDAVTAHDEMQRYYTAYWRAKGVDWERRLADSGNALG
jgi:hypothetical protein